MARTYQIQTRGSPYQRAPRSSTKPAPQPKFDGCMLGHPAGRRDGYHPWQRLLCHQPGIIWTRAACLCGFNHAPWWSWRDRHPMAVSPPVRYGLRQHAIITKSVPPPLKWYLGLSRLASGRKKKAARARRTDGTRSGRIHTRRPMTWRHPIKWWKIMFGEDRVKSGMRAGRRQCCWAVPVIAYRGQAVGSMVTFYSPCSQPARVARLLRGNQVTPPIIFAKRSIALQRGARRTSSAAGTGILKL